MLPTGILQKWKTKRPVSQSEKPLAVQRNQEVAHEIDMKALSDIKHLMLAHVHPFRHVKWYNHFKSTLAKSSRAEGPILVPSNSTRRQIP